MRVGTICYATEQGIGYLPKDFYDNGIVTDVMVFRHGSRATHMEWYPEGTVELVGRPFTGPAVEAFLRRIDTLLIFETPFDWNVLKLAKMYGTRVVIVPMYECTPQVVPVEPDCWACPSALDVQYFRGPLVPVPVKQPWVQRKRCWKFLHNGGNLGLRGHKGTREILQAWWLCRKPIDLTVRAQDTAGLRKLLNEVFPVGGYQLPENNVYVWDRLGGFAKLTVDMRPVAREGLFPVEYDAFVMAEKYNGLSLPIQEARASGMLVVTSNRFPMNTWLPEWPLIEVAGYSKQRVGGSFMQYDEAEVTPQAIADKLDALLGEDISTYSASGKEWAEENSWEKLRPKWLEVLRGA